MGRMKLWASLYGMIWLVFVQIWLGYTPIAPPVPLYLHIVLGIGVLALAAYNFVELRKSTCPGRIKRIARATLALALLMAVLGVLLYLNVGANWNIAWGISIGSGIHFLHFVNAMAILSQASAVAVVYDVWEEKEFLNSTAPGEIPPPAGPK